MRKGIFGIALALLIAFILAMAFSIQPAKASGTIYIMADGSVVGTTDITTVDDITYTFINDIYDEIVVLRSNITVDGNGKVLQNLGSGIGFALYGINHVTIKNTTIKNFTYGIYLNSSSSNSISENNLANNSVGIYLNSSSNNIISRNIITASMNISVALHDSSSNTVSGNNITHSTVGIEFYEWIPNQSELNTVYGNNITNNRVGVVFYWQCGGNTLFHNNFIDNDQQVFIETMADASTWDKGYPSGGNYWSDYVGGDMYHGPNQDQPDSDGIGDTPHVLVSPHQDNYPLMHPWTLPIKTSVTVSGTTHPVEIVSNTTLTDIDIDKNQLSFNSSGTADGGYVLVIFPMVNTTLIRVRLDDDWLDPPPFPVITKNATHYFIYFEFTLSTHTITIQFAVSAPPAPVGGKTTPINIPMNKPETSALWIWLSTIILLLATTVVYVKKGKKDTEINS